MIWRLLFPLVAALAPATLPQAPGWEPGPGYRQIEIWPGRVPDARKPLGPELVRTVGGKEMVAGRTWTEVDNVSRPTITVYSPKGRNTGAAVVVFPGGGYQILAIDLEGSEVCEWFASRGVTAVLLKYRVPAPRSDPYWGAYPQSPIALEDAQRAMGMVRLHAKRWHINPRKIGVVGFSAGGHLVAAISTHFRHRLYKAIDAADRKSCRPDFAIALYPGHLWMEKTGQLNTYVPVTPHTPPTLIVQAKNDPVDSVNNSKIYYAALKRARVPVEMHLYPEGRHAFGLRPTKFPITRWPELAMKWLRSIHMLP